MQKQVHSLKILPEYFEAVISGVKTFEIRKDDRGFKVGDTIILDEIFHKYGEYTYRSIKVEITYILRGGEYGLDENYVIMSIKIL